MVFEGELEIKEAGDFKFRLGSDDGSRLFINGKELIDNDGMHAVKYKEESIELEPGMAQVRVEYFDSGGAQRLSLSVSGPGIKELSGKKDELLLSKEKGEDFMKEVLSPKGKLATYGLKQVEMALNMGAVKHLLISEGFEKMENIEEGTLKRLGEMAENSNSEVSIISTESEEGISLQKAFGGLAAILRYPIS